MGLQAERFGGSEVDDQLELGRLHDRQVRRLRALEYEARLDAELTPCVRQAGSIAHQPAARCVTCMVMRG